MADETPQKKRKLPRWLVLGAIALFGLCVIIGIVQGVNNALAPTSIPTSAPEPAATNTPEPTNTPRPTSTPRPTATPRASAEEAAYAEQVAGITTDISAALTKLGGLMTDASDDPELLFDDAWKLEVVIQAAVIQVSHTMLEEITPPASMRLVHTQLLDGTQDCYDAMNHLATGIDDLDTGELDTASVLIESCGNKIGLATDLLP